MNRRKPWQQAPQDREPAYYLADKQRQQEQVQRLTEVSKHKAYEAGKIARDTGKDIKSFSAHGWGYPKGLYFGWFRLGFYGDDFRADLSQPAEMSYGERKARSLIAAAYRDIGRYSKAESVLKPEYQSMGLKAFAAYIESVE